MVKCGSCAKFMATNTDGATCPKCSTVFHRACVNIPKGAQIQPDWICECCKASRPRDNKPDTPVRGIQHCFKMVVAADNEKSTQDEYSLELKTEISLFRDELRAAREEIRSFRQEMSEIKSTLKAFDGRLEILENKITVLETKHSMAGSSEVEALETTVSELRRELNDRDQVTLLNDLEIAGIPETAGENVTHVATLIAAKLGVSLDERDIASVERAGARRRAGAVAGHGNGEGLRPRPIVVRLTRRAPRDLLIKNARVRRNSTTEGLDLPSGLAPRPFYINERMTKINRHIFYKTREMCRQCKSWKYVWTRNGITFVRKEEGKPAQQVRSEDDLNRIFGSNDVRPDRSGDSR